MRSVPDMSATEWEALEGLLSLAYWQRSAHSKAIASLWGEIVAGNREIAIIPRSGFELFVWIGSFALSDLCSDQIRASIVHARTADPDRLLDLCHEVAGTTRSPGDLWGRLRRFRGVETHKERAERLKPRPYVRRRVYRDPDREAQRLLMEDPDARYRLGIAIGGRAQGKQIKGILCPNCGRRSVYYYIDPRVNRDKSARCNHRNSCQFWATVYELGRGYSGQ